MLTTLDIHASSTMLVNLKTYYVTTDRPMQTPDRCHVGFDAIATAKVHSILLNFVRRRVHSGRCSMVHRLPTGPCLLCHIDPFPNPYVHLGEGCAIRRSFPTS